MIRTFWVIIVAVTMTVVLGLLAIVGAYVGLTRRYYQWTCRVWARSLLWASGTPVRVLGQENIDRVRPQVIASNHQSAYDIFALAAHIPVPYHFVAKRELERIPIFGRAVRAAGHVFIARDDRASAIESLKVAGRKLKEEASSAVVFPEGTRSLTGQLQNLKKGPFIMAIEAGVPIVPTVVEGTFGILPKRGRRICPQPITLWFGRPVDASRYSHAQRDALVADVQARMRTMLEQLRRTQTATSPR